VIEFDDLEWSFRRRRYEQLRDGIDDLPTVITEAERLRAEGRPAFEELRDRFLSTGDVDALRGEMDAWSRTHRTFGFAAVNGQMFLKQLVNDSDPQHLAGMLRQLITVPADDESMLWVDRGTVLW
jgi:hypothetical protein